MVATSAKGAGIGVVTASLLATLGIPADAPAAVAYPQDPNNCNDSSLTWDFEPSALWGAKAGQVSSAIASIDNALDYDGTQLVTQQQTGGIAVQIKDKPMSEYGSSECVTGASIWVNSNYSAASFYYKVARHEMLHLAGAEHGGEYDSYHFDGLKPATMASGLNPSTFLSTNQLEQDASAYENWLHSSLANRQLTANIGFEQGFSSAFWGKSDSGIVLELKTTQGATGPSHIRYHSESVNTYLYQTARLILGDDNESYRGVANARAHTASYKTTVGVALYRRGVYLANTPDNGVVYADGIDNANGNPAVGGWIQTATRVQEVGTSWTMVETNDPSAWVNPPDGLAKDFQIRFYGLGQDASGNLAPVWVDNVRGEGT